MFEFPIKEFFKQPRSLLGGWGAYENAGPEAAAMGLNHVLVRHVGVSGTGIIDECKTNFENAGVSVTVYDKVESNPKDYNVMDAYKAFSEGECDGFVSIGGGSSHDTTKGARIVAAHDGRNVNEFQELNASETLDNPAHIAINTTVGTGSETTPAYVITDLRRRCAAQVGRFRPGGHNDAGDQRPHPVHDAAAGVRGVHGLRHHGPRPRSATSGACSTYRRRR